MVLCSGVRRKTVLTHQCFSCLRAEAPQRGLSSFSCCPADGKAWSAQGAGTRTADQSGQRGSYPTPYGILSASTAWGSWLGGLPLPGVWLGIGRWVVSNCTVHHLFCVHIITTTTIIILISFSVFLNCLYLNP